MAKKRTNATTTGAKGGPKEKTKEKKGHGGWGLLRSTFRKAASKQAAVKVVEGERDGGEGGGGEGGESGEGGEAGGRNGRHLQFYASSSGGAAGGGKSSVRRLSHKAARMKAARMGGPVAPFAFSAEHAVPLGEVEGEEGEHDGDGRSDGSDGHAGDVVDVEL